MKILTIIKNWFQERRDRKAKALPDGYIDIVDLYKKGLVSAKGTGQSITDISAEIVSRVNAPLKVSVAHGTYICVRMSKRGDECLWTMELDDCIQGNWR
jgi:hypothetical protein